VEFDACYGKDLRSIPRDILGDVAAHLLFWGSMFGVIDEPRQERLSASIDRFVAAGHKQDSQ
jgi:hypothetical protein